jgi:hypothetical protein
VGYGYECSFQPKPSKAARLDGGPRQSTNATGRTDHLNESHHLLPTSPLRDGDLDVNEEGSATHQRTRNGSIAEIPVRDQSVLEPYKSRFVSAHSMIAYPRSVGVDLKMANPPRLHSYAWHTGIRPERPPPVSSRVCDMLSLEQSRPFFDAYFNLVNPIYSTINHDNFLQRCKLYWASPGIGIDFEAVVCGVIALGSIFSGPNACPMEWELMDQARLVLEMSVSQPPGNVSSDHVVAWILRSLYLRLTTRPHLSWVAICTTVHLAEAIGLHQELDTVTFTVEGSPQLFGAEERESRRRIFWVAWSLNRLFAAEYGRSRAHVDNIRCRQPSPQKDDFVCALVELIDLLHGGFIHGADSTSGIELGSALEHLGRVADSHPALMLLKADICLIICRRLRLTSRKYSREQIGVILSILRKALSECRSFALLQYPWWSVLSLPFHTVCLLLSINSHESMEMLNEAMETLVDVSLIYDTHLAREAVKTARQLIGQAAKRKREELIPMEELSQEHGSNSSVVLTETTELMNGNLFEGMLEDDLGWTQFFGSEFLQP